MTAITPTTPTTHRPKTSRFASARLNRQVAAATGGTGTRWDYLYNAVVTTFPGLAPKDGTFCQFSAAPIPASWTTPESADGYSIADDVPSNLDGFYIGGGSFSKAYASLIRSIRPTTGDSNPDYIAIQQKLNDAENNYQAVVAAAKAAYHVDMANNPGPNGTPGQTFQAWMGDPFGGASFGDKVLAVQHVIDEYNSELAEILKAMGAATADAVANLTTDTMNISTGGPAVDVPRTTIGGDIANDKVRWDTAGAAPEFDSGPMNSEVVVVSPWKTVVTTTVSHDSCGGTTVSSQVDTSRIIADEHFSMRVTALGFQNYPIKRGQWYDETFVNVQTQIVQGAGVTNDTFFGLHGSLHMIPESIVVMYKPTISLTMSTQIYKEEIESNASGSGGGFTNLFGYQYDFNGLHDLNPQGDEVTTTITFPAPEVSVPQILGVISKSVYNGNP